MPISTRKNTRPLSPHQPAPPLEPWTAWSEIKAELDDAENPPPPRPSQRFYPPERWVPGERGGSLG